MNSNLPVIRKIAVTLGRYWASLFAFGFLLLALGHFLAEYRWIQEVAGISICLALISYISRNVARRMGWGKLE